MRTRPIGLKRQRVPVSAPRSLTFEVVASAGKSLEERPDGAKVVQFSTTFRGKEVPTTELVVIEPPDHIRYEWLQGPLPEVNEIISFIDNGEGTELVYEGDFSAGPGLINWVYGRLVVKPIFDRLVLKHLEQSKCMAEQRARRTRVHPGPTADDSSNHSLPRSQPTT